MGKVSSKWHLLLMIRSLDLRGSNCVLGTFLTLCIYNIHISQPGFKLSGAETMCNHRNPAHRSGGCPQSFLPLPLPTEPHGLLAKYHHRHHKVANPQGASSRALGLASGLSTWVGSASQSQPSRAHACACTCPHRPQKGDA